MTGAGWIGAKIYDVLLLRAASECGAERIYTFNLADFRKLAPEGLRKKYARHDLPVDYDLAVPKSRKAARYAATTIVKSRRSLVD
ncbi:MAG: hypothetical protein JO051_14850 [Acidobacteriaceae bacterium]|nr:hypothetical protein [Acidobacteriaceae bacterium]